MHSSIVGGDQERKETAPFFFPSCCEEAAHCFHHPSWQRRAPEAFGAKLTDYSLKIFLENFLVPSAGEIHYSNSRSDDLLGGLH